MHRFAGDAPRRAGCCGEEILHAPCGTSRLGKAAASDRVSLRRNRAAGGKAKNVQPQMHADACGWAGVRQVRSQWKPCNRTCAAVPRWRSLPHPRASACISGCKFLACCLARRSLPQVPPCATHKPETHAPEPRAMSRARGFKRRQNPMHLFSRRRRGRRPRASVSNRWQDPMHLFVQSRRIASGGRHRSAGGSAGGCASRRSCSGTSPRHSYRPANSGAQGQCCRRNLTPRVTISVATKRDVRETPSASQ